MIRGDLFRFQNDKFQTLGTLSLWINAKLEFKCSTLELSWNDNKNNISCIPEGTYKVVKRNSPKYGDHFHILNVPNRDYILIHHGNYHTDIKGCILVGSKHQDINKDGLSDVIESKKTMNDLNKIMKSQNEFMLRIYS